MRSCAPKQTFRIQRLLAICAGLACCAIFGCSSAPVEPPLLPVSGTVKVEGQPLPVGWVTFYADEAKGNTSTRLAFAEIAKDGTYTLATNGKPGVSAGFYKIVIMATLEPTSAKPRTNPDGSLIEPNWLTHAKYTKPQTTDLLIEVVENPAPGRYDLELVR